MFESSVSARTVLSVVMSLVASLFTSDCSAHAENLSTRLIRASYFAASMKYAAFPVRKSDDSFGLLLADLETGILKKLSVKGSSILSPYFSADGKRLLFVHHPLKQKSSELVSCSIESLLCNRLLHANDRSISFPVELSDGRILYVSSPYLLGRDGRGWFGRNDLWLLKPKSEPRKLTDIQLFSLGPIGVSTNNVYFSGDGATPDRPVIPRMDYNATKQSDIFSLSFDTANEVISSPTQTLQPLFLDEGKARSPSASSDGSIVAYLRSITTGNYKYDLIVRNEADRTERTVTAPSLGFSSPVVVDHSVFANAIYHNEYRIYAVHPEQETKHSNAITDAAIENAEIIELAFDKSPKNP